MVTEFTESNAPANQQRWVRQVQGAIRAVEAQTDSTANRVAGAASSQKGTLSLLKKQVSDLQDITAGLQATTNYLAGLVTVSTQGNNYLVDNIPGDQTNRWSAGDGSTTVTVNAPTGRLLVTFGAGSVESRAGNSTMYSMMRLALSSPSGWSVTLGANTRMFVTSGTTIGMPFSSERTFDGVPTNEPITVQVQFGTWSAATTTLAAASFLTPFVRAQVVRA